MNKKQIDTLGKRSMSQLDFVRMNIKSLSSFDDAIALCQINSHQKNKQIISQIILRFAVATETPGAKIPDRKETVLKVGIFAPFYGKKEISTSREDQIARRPLLHLNYLIDSGLYSFFFLYTELSFFFSRIDIFIQLEIFQTLLSS
jgi:hypothetical protein